MIDSEDVSNVELSRDKLLVILNLIEEVREVCILTLLLERAGHMLTNMIVFMVHLFSPLHVVCIVRHTFHEICFHYTSTVRVLEVHILAHLTIIACVAMLAIAYSRASIILPESIALHLV